jgi:hypothetical protein
VEARLSEARDELAAADPSAALETVARALALEPDDPDALLVKAHALVEDDRPDQAEEILAGLGGLPGAAMLGGRIAEDRGDWLTAMERYRAAPEGTPGRAEALERAQLRWRLSVLPDYVQEALASQDLSRSQLAALMVSLVPATKAIGGGRVPLLSDVVDLPSQQDIVTAVRLELIPVDPLEHSFHPTAEVAPDEVRAALDRLAQLLGVPAIRWCESPSVISLSCKEIESPIQGSQVADLVLGLVHGEDP